MVLGLNESVSTQSMSVNDSGLTLCPSDLADGFVTAFRRESDDRALLIGICLRPFLSAVIVWVWRTDARWSVRYRRKASRLSLVTGIFVRP